MGRRAADGLTKKQRAEQRKELARLLLEAALSRCAELGVGITLRVNSLKAVVSPALLLYHHPEEP